MARIIGIGGVFFRSNDSKELTNWYAEHLGLPRSPHGTVKIPWRHHDDPTREGMTVWSSFPKTTDDFGPTNPESMINHVIDDLDAMLVKLREEGVSVDDRVDDSEYGRFGWAIDPDGNRIELWEPSR